MSSLPGGIPLCRSPRLSSTKCCNIYIETVSTRCHVSGAVHHLCRDPDSVDLSVDQQSRVGLPCFQQRRPPAAEEDGREGRREKEPEAEYQKHGCQSGARSDGGSGLEYGFVPHHHGNPAGAGFERCFELYSECKSNFWLIFIMGIFFVCLSPSHVLVGGALKEHQFFF